MHRREDRFVLEFVVRGIGVLVLQCHRVVLPLAFPIASAASALYRCCIRLIYGSFRFVAVMGILERLLRRHSSFFLRPAFVCADCNVGGVLEETLPERDALAQVARMLCIAVDYRHD
ncbi:hypothetical protein ABW21_db0203969 [Orbilia brochopaga]|nr:hypothetical protein ABW21_db0203969 [Drechslerella brochopaga]